MAEDFGPALGMVETRGLVRYYDNNNFYREPVVQRDLTPDA